MDAQVVWREGLEFAGMANSSVQIPLGPAKSEGGSSSGASPMELLLIGLAGCTAMDVISLLQKKRQQVTGFQVRAHADRAEEFPKVFTHIRIEYVITGHALERVAAERSVELSTTKYCPAYAMLSKAVTIETKVTLVEADQAA
jgi:putative redox protein